MVDPTIAAEMRQLLVERRAREFAWARFEASTHRNALALARTPATTPGGPR
jgi:hypothetical protein